MERRFFFEKENNSKLFSYNVCLGITVYITITFLIYNIVLLPTSMPNTPKAWTSSAIEHMVTPIATVCYFLFIMKKTVVVNSKTITRKTTWRFLIFPIAWCIISLIRGEFRYDAGKNNPYQYFFLNLHDPKFGIPGFVWFIIAFIVVFSMIYGFTSLYNYYRFRYQNLFSSNHKLIH